MRVAATLILLLSTTIAAAGSDSDSDRKEAAKQFFKGIYGCDKAAVSKYGSQDVRLSYPIFERLFNKPVLSGNDAVTGFAERFCSRWKKASFEFHHVVEEGNKVVLVWSFSAESAVEGAEMPPVGTRSSWGGISLFEFDDEGKIRLELGEESTPGPAARIAQMGQSGASETR